MSKLEEDSYEMLVFLRPRVLSKVGSVECATVRRSGALQVAIGLRTTLLDAAIFLCVSSLVVRHSLLCRLIVGC